MSKEHPTPWVADTHILVSIKDANGEYVLEEGCNPAGDPPKVTNDPDTILQIVSSVNNLAGVPKPEGIPELIRLAEHLYNDGYFDAEGSKCGFNGKILTGEGEILRDALLNCGIEVSDD